MLGDLKMKQNINTLPVEVQNEIKSTLKVFDKVSVIFENGEYKATTGCCIKAVYADDFKVIGIYNKDEIYTKEEQILIYTEEFLSYPIEYKGKRDWAMIKQLTELRKSRKQAILHYVDNNIQIKEIIYNG